MNVLPYPMMTSRIHHRAGEKAPADRKSQDRSAVLRWSSSQPRNAREICACPGDAMPFAYREGEHLVSAVRFRVGVPSCIGRFTLSGTGREA